MDPHKFLADFERKSEQMQQQLAESQEQLASARSEVTSSDGTVTVTVAGGGGIESLTLSPKATQLAHTVLADRIMDTIRQAQVEAARSVQESMRPLLGDGEGMDFLTEQVDQGIARMQRSEHAPGTEPRRSAVEDIELDWDDDEDDWDERGGR
ncbi:YbaB/EbfC family nucleoid-associated protein [Allosaccharopolyspora coralli]|uniref:YbaB/EbfC family nucleoid-associated protein n=1 Tax=Allosaccharopolyspora coralli TaxID=2665642 RepID=UPI0016524100|nr:YbaB/EbfC family nucleoid-associated protein [Allosaccharopolyspora coralli]